MKRTALLIGLGALLLGLALSQPSVSQMEKPAAGPMAQMPSSENLQMEIGLLRALDVAGLSKEQISKLQAIVANLKAARDALHQAHQQLRDFLVGFQGSPTDFEQAVAPYDKKVEEAELALQGAMKTGMQQVKGLLTISQGEAFLKALRPMQRKALGSDEEEMAPMMQKMQAMMQAMESMPGMKGMMGMKGNPAMGPMHEQMMGQMREMRMRGELAARNMQWGRMLLAHLDLLDRVLTEKLAKMKG